GGSRSTDPPCAPQGAPTGATADKKTLSALRGRTVGWIALHRSTVAPPGAPAGAMPPCEGQKRPAAKASRLKPLPQKPAERTGSVGGALAATAFSCRPDRSPLKRLLQVGATPGCLPPRHPGINICHHEQQTACHLESHLFSTSAKLAGMGTHRIPVRGRRCHNHRGQRLTGSLRAKRRGRYLS